MSPIRNGFVAAAGGDMARAALNAGLVDHVGDRTAFGRRMAELAGTDDDDVPGSYRAIHYDAWVDDHPVEPTGRRDRHPHRRRRRSSTAMPRPGTAGGETIARDLERGLRAAATSRRWSSGSIRRAAR